MIYSIQAAGQGSVCEDAAVYGMPAETAGRRFGFLREYCVEPEALRRTVFFTRLTEGQRIRFQEAVDHRKQLRVTIMQIPELRPVLYHLQVVARISR